MEKVEDQSLWAAFISVIRRRPLRKAAVKSVVSIFYHFFFLQYRAALLPGRIPVSRVDHPLDGDIPFRPRWVGVYLDFVAFWVRMIGFLLRRYPRSAREPVRRFIMTMGELYAFAAEVYVKNLSTTRRPRYYSRPRFALIHLADPHLMCIPSLHVMVVIRTYTSFRQILRSLGEAERMASRIGELRRGALAITEAILYVKQHSVNCIPAAMYAMTCFDPSLFPPEEAADFASRLFRDPQSPEQGEAIREYIIALYHRFLSEGRIARSWKDPLLVFLAARPPAGR
ncbi:MAG: hypothetical protein LBD78_01445 [Spirochaetaceae bacterium]|nr:hypothetical protein [Spirochaetaceae bacterium]